MSTLTTEEQAIIQQAQEAQALNADIRTGPTPDRIAVDLCQAMIDSNQLAEDELSPPKKPRP